VIHLLASRQAGLLSPFVCRIKSFASIDTNLVGELLLPLGPALRHVHQRLDRQPLHIQNGRRNGQIQASSCYAETLATVVIDGQLPAVLRLVHFEPSSLVAALRPLPRHKECAISPRD
jgi:hypothetical protein